jgi:putative multiple sugar transport system ATP-binding protein
VCEFAGIRDSERAGIVIIHQELALCPQLSIAENIFLGNEQASGGLIDWNRTNQRAGELLDRVGLRESAVTPVGELGVGKQQLVEIAKALSKKVRLLILDEPTAALGADDSAHLLDLLRGLRADGVTSVIVSHKLNEIMAIADSITVLRDGRTVETLDVAGGAVTEDRIIAGMVGRDLEHRFPPHEPKIGAEALRIEDWTVHSPTRPDHAVVDRANLVLRRGEIVGLAGLMGAGRTELAMSVFGRSYGRDISGRLVKDGRPIEVRSVREAIANGIAYVTEDRKRYGLNLIEDVKRNISAVGLSRLARRGWVNENEEYRIAGRFRASMNIKVPTVNTVTGTLSGGNQQKVVLAKWLSMRPRMVIFDEPTRGIDVGAKQEIYQLMRRLADGGVAILMISSDMEEVIGVSDRIAVMHEGAIAGLLDRPQFSELNVLHLAIGQALEEAV